MIKKIVHWSFVVCIVLAFGLMVPVLLMLLTDMEGLWDATMWIFGALMVMAVINVMAQMILERKRK